MASRVVASGLQTPQRQVVSARPSATSKSAPSTPVTTDSPGNWRHPRMDEITRRRAASVFTETNLKTLVYNSVALVAVYLAGRATGAPFQQLRQLLHSVISPQHSGLLTLLVNAVLLFNMARALLPLFRQPDTLSDIPLTPSQRKLLGLPPLKSAAAPSAVYTTPPRYARTPSTSASAVAAGMATATQHSGGGSSNDVSYGRSFSASGSGSPLTNSPLFPKARNANVGGGASGSPFSPSSPFQNGRKSSFGSPGASMASSGASLFGDAPLPTLPGTPSPTSGKRLSMGLNNKWLYEKGRRSSSGTRLY